MTIEDPLKHELDNENESELSATKKIKTEHPDQESVNDLQSFRLRIDNLKKFMTKKDIVKLFDAQSLAFKNISKGPKNMFCFVSFDDEESMTKAKESLDAFEWKGNVLKVIVAKPKADVRPAFNRDNSNIANEDGRSVQEKLADQVTPLWRKSYAEQLELKQGEARQPLWKFQNELFKIRHSRMRDQDKSQLTETERENAKRGVEQLAWLSQPKDKSTGLLFVLKPIIASPVEQHYRNKCEFTFGKTPDGKLAVGFLLGGFKDGQVNVGDASECLHINQPAKDIASVLHEYAEASPLSVYDRISKSGVWRLALVRTFSTGESMVLVQAATANVDADVLKTEKDRLVSLFDSKASSFPTLNVKSILFQEFDGHFHGLNENAPTSFLKGDGVICEALFGITFEVSANSFFQTNTAATEILYSKVKELCLSKALETDGKAETESAETSETTTKKNVVLLDLCCGTGTIGITLAKHFNKVIGVDIVQSAIDDAKRNAERNGITNVEYLCGKAEDQISHVFSTYVDPENDIVVAVLDPPRSGVHASVIHAIRGCEQLKHVVYVSCDVKQAMQNFVTLCRPTSNKNPGDPFRPRECTPVDLFPQTSHFEVVLYFSR